MLELIERRGAELDALCREHRVARLELFGSAVIGLLARFPCSWLPDHKPGEIQSKPPNRAGRGEWIARGVDAER